MSARSMIGRHLSGLCPGRALKTPIRTTRSPYLAPSAAEQALADTAQPVLRAILDMTGAGQIRLRVLTRSRSAGRVEAASAELEVDSWSRA